MTKPTGNYWLDRVHAEKEERELLEKIDADMRRDDQIWLATLILFAIVAAVIIGFRTYLADGPTMIPTGIVLTALMWGCILAVWIRTR